MKILVTGGAGFIGSHVIHKLPRDAVLDIVDCYEPRVHGIVDPSWIFRCDNVRDFSDVDIIIHLAAQVGVADSMSDPLRYVEDNTLDTARFLRNLRASGARPRRMVVASSMSVYGDPETSKPISEGYPLRPASVYGLTKLDQERLCLMYGEMLGIPTCALRFWNVYGPGQALSNPYTGVLAIFANALLNGKRPKVYEDGLQTRDFVYVGDVADAVVRMAFGSAEGVFNVATGQATTIYDVAKSLAKALGVDIEPEILGMKRPGDIRHAIGDSRKLKETLLGWEPRTFSEGLESYAAYLKTLQQH